MSGRRNKLIAVLVLLAFAFGLAACVFACGPGQGNCEGDEAASHMCFCQTVSLPVAGSESVVVNFWLENHPATDERLILPLFADSIFQPPRA
jgi:hypothetical protein